MTTAILIGLVLQQGAPPLSARMLDVVNGGRLPQVERELLRTSDSELIASKRVPELAWALIWRARLQASNLVKERVPDKTIKRMGRLIERSEASADAETLLAYRSFEAQFYMYLLGPGQGEWRTEQIRVLTRDPGKPPFYETMTHYIQDGPGKRLEAKWDGWFERARRLAPNHPQVLLVQLERTMGKPPAVRRQALDAAQAAGADRYWPLTFRILAREILQTPEARKALKDHLKATRNDLVTLTAVRGDIKLKALQDEP